jgi:hypothetical protein
MDCMNMTGGMGGGVMIVGMGVQWLLFVAVGMLGHLGSAEESARAPDLSPPAAQEASAAFGPWLIIALWLLRAGPCRANRRPALIGLSLPRRPRSREHYGSWDRLIL